jgi:hypothetical protein
MPTGQDYRNIRRAKSICNSSAVWRSWRKKPHQYQLLIAEISKEGPAGDYSPFPSKAFFLLYLLLNSPRPHGQRWWHDSRYQSPMAIIDNMPVFISTVPDHSTTFFCISNLG